MGNLPYIFPALLLNQILFIAANGQQDLKNYPFALINPSSVLYTINAPSIEQTSYDSRFNVPHTSYDDKPEPAETVQLTQLSYLDNWNRLIEERSRGNLRNRILSNEQSPVELHHGYRYIAPALPLSNITNLKNVIYNELGLNENHISINRLPQGFVLHQPDEIKKNIRPLLQKFQNKTEIFTIKNYFPDQQNFQNTTILSPVKDLNFTYNNSQHNLLNNLYKDEQILNHYNLNQQQVTQEEMKNKINTNEPSVSNTAYLPQRHRDLFNIAPSGKIYQQLLTDSDTKVGNFQKNTSLGQKDFVSNFSTTQHLQCENKTLPELHPLENKIMLNIKPSVDIFKNIDSGNAAAENFYPLHLTNDGVKSNFPKMEYKLPFASGDQQYFFQHENLKLPLKKNFVFKKNFVDVQPTSETFPVYFPYKDESSSQSNDKVFNGVLANTEPNAHPIKFFHRNEQKLQFQEMPFEPYSHDNTKNQEYYFNPTQQNSGNFQTSELNNKNLFGGTKPSEYKFSYPIEQPQNTNSPYSIIPTAERLITKASYENSFSKPVNQYILQSKYPPTKYLQSIIESYFASNVKNEELQAHQNYKVANGRPEIQNQSNINNLLQPSLSSQTFYSNRIIFPKNNIINNTSNYMSVVPDFSDQYFISKPQNSNEFLNLGSNYHLEYPEENYKTSPFITNSKNNILLKTIGNNNKSLLDNIQMQQQHNRIPLNGTLLKILLNQKPFKAQQNPVLPISDVLINPRTANNPNEISSFTPPQTRSIEFPLPSDAVTANNPEQQNYQSERPQIVSKISQEKLRLPHLIYGPPT